MAIVIRQRGDFWRVEIREEEFEFQTLEDMQDKLNDLIKMKIKYGKLKRE